MPKAYSGDVRQRVIAQVEGGASRREVAEEFEISASTAIIWVKCFRETGRCAAKPRGGSISPLEKHSDFLLGLIEQQPDLTLDEVVLAMRKHKIPEARSPTLRGPNSRSSWKPTRIACSRWCATSACHRSARRDGPQLPRMSLGLVQATC